MGKKAKKPEEAFMDQVLQLAELSGWRRAHFRTVTVMGKRGPYCVTPVQADGKGFPDLVLVRGKRLIFAELKAGRCPAENRPTPEQRKWLEALTATGVETYLWTPENWPDIKRALRPDPHETHDIGGEG